jgi:hypothetical protein
MDDFCEIIVIFVVILQFQERKLFIEELDSNISALMISIYPLCPSKLDKHEPAAILLNQLMQKRMNVNNATIIYIRRQWVSLLPNSIARKKHVLNDNFILNVTCFYWGVYERRVSFSRATSLVLQSYPSDLIRWPH